LEVALGTEDMSVIKNSLKEAKIEAETLSKEFLAMKKELETLRN